MLEEEMSMAILNYGDFMMLIAERTDDIVSNIAGERTDGFIYFPRICK